MRKTIKSYICATLIAVMVICKLSYLIVSAETDKNNMTQEQINAIEMLNYITVLSQEINASKNSRVFMEEAYSLLINNTNPNAVDSRTLNQMNGLLDTMENYRMIDVKRERLQYVYEQSQAQAIRAAVPNPMGLLSATHSFDPVKLVTSVVYMAVDSATSYQAYTSEVEQKYLQDGWALDDDEAKVLHDNRKGTFSYMVKMVNDYDLPGELTLTENTVEELVKWKNNSNITGRIQFLESNKKTYQSYGGYWLILAESYYQNSDYKKCLEAVDTYEKMNINIFRRDYDYADVLPLAIASAKETYDIEKYVEYASEHAGCIVDNTDHNNWALRYFAAQTYVDIYAENYNKDYLEKAYTIVVDNVNYLMGEQTSLNSAYLSPVIEKNAPSDASKEQKKEIKNYNKMLKESREVEMAPIYDPLILNCELLFALADELKISSSEKQKIDNMLHPNGEPLFLIKTLDDQFRFDKTGSQKETHVVTASFDKTTLSIPTAFLTSESKIQVSVLDPDGSNAAVFTDWSVKEVTRESDSDIYTYKTIYTSDSCKKFDWKPNQTINIDVVCYDGYSTQYHFVYRTEGNKNQWYDYGKVWEGEVSFIPGS